MKRNTSNWSNFGMLLRRAGLTASAGLSCYNCVWCEKYLSKFAAKSVCKVYQVYELKLKARTKFDVPSRRPGVRAGQ